MNISAPCMKYQVQYSEYKYNTSIKHKQRRKRPRGHGLSEVLNFELSRVWTLFLQDSMNLFLLILNFRSRSIDIKSLLSLFEPFESHTRVSLRPKRDGRTQKV